MIFFFLLISCSNGWCLISKTLKSSGGDYASWEEMITDLTTTYNALSDDLTVTVSPAKYVEDTYAPTCTIDLNGHTVIIKAIDGYGPHSSDGKTGPQFDLQLPDSAHHFLFLDAKDTGQFIVEGLTFDVDESSSSPANVFYLANDAASVVTIRNCVFKGQQDEDAIYSSNINTTIRIYNNFFYNFYTAITTLFQATDSFIGNNTIYGCAQYGISLSSKDILAMNNLVYNNGTDFLLPGSATGYNNLCSDTTCEDGDFSTGNGNQPSKTVSFTSTSDDEYFLASDEVIAIDGGTVTAYDDLVAHYRFERGYLTEDSSDNSNTITAVSDPASIMSDYREGNGAIDYDSDDYHVRPDGDLSDDFPGKQDSANTDLTVSLWIRPTGSGSNNRDLISIAAAGTENGKIWAVRIDASDKISFLKGYDNGASWETTTYSTALTEGSSAPWYRIDVTYDESGAIGAAKGVRIRVWDDTAKAWLSSDTTATHGNAMDTSTTYTPDFVINALKYNGTYYPYDCEMDGIRIYNRALTPDELDEAWTLNHDAFNRPRDTSPDIGAYEYIAPVDYYVSADNGDNSNNGTSTSTEWEDFTNVDSMIFNPGDTLNLAMDDEWNDTLWITAVGSTVNGNGVTVTKYIDDTSTTNPIIHGTSGSYGINYKTSSHVITENIIAESCSSHGIYAASANDLTFTNVESNRNGGEGVDTSIYSGFTFYAIDNLNLTNCTGNWNHGHGFYLGYTNDGTCNIAGSTFNYNGLIHGNKQGFGILTSCYADSGYDDILNVTNTIANYNGYIGIGPGTNSIIDNCTANYNGDGWGTQGVKIFSGTLTGNLGDLDTVTQENTNAAGIVHHCNSSYFIKDGHSIWLSLWEESGTFNGTDKIVKDVSNYWEPTTVIDYEPDSDWSGGGMDLRNSDNTIVRYCLAIGNLTVYHVGIDGYGINIDDETDGAKVYYSISTFNRGAGFKIHNSGKVAMNYLYHCLSYGNSVSVATAAGIHIADLEGGDVTIKNCISLLDTNWAFRVAAASLDTETLVLDYNNYYMGAGEQDLVRWGTTEYTSLEFEDYQTDTGQDVNSIATDPSLVDPANGDYRLAFDSPCIDTGVDLTGSTEATDYHGNSVPVDGDQAGGGQSDIGHYEYSIGWKWGAASEEAGYHDDGLTERGWTEGTGAISGDSQTGILELDDDEYLLGPVINTGSTATKHLSISKGSESGTGTLCWRGQSTKFEQTDTDPSWEVYSKSENKDWQYVQIAVDNDDDNCASLP